MCSQSRIWRQISQDLNYGQAHSFNSATDSEQLVDTWWKQVKNFQKEKVRVPRVNAVILYSSWLLKTSVMTLQKDDLYAAPAVEWTMMSAGRTFQLTTKSNPQLWTLDELIVVTILGLKVTQRS